VGFLAKLDWLLRVMASSSFLSGLFLLLLFGLGFGCSLGVPLLGRSCFEPLLAVLIAVALVCWTGGSFFLVCAGSSGSVFLGLLRSDRTLLDRRMLRESVLWLSNGFGCSSVAVDGGLGLTFKVFRLLVVVFLMVFLAGSLAGCLLGRREPEAALVLSLGLAAFRFRELDERTEAEGLVVTL